MTEREFKAGDRVQINPADAHRFTQPWENRVKKGLFGTITGGSEKDGWFVRLDMPARAKWVHDWRWGGVRSSDLLKIDAGGGAS